MNSFAALIGALTGAPVAGAALNAGAGLAASPAEGLFAGFLEAGAAAQQGTEVETVLSLRAALLSGSGASALGTIAVNSQLDSAAELDGTLLAVPAIALTQELTIDAPVPAELAISGALLSPAQTAGGAEPDDTPGEDAPDPDAALVIDIPVAATQTTLPDTGQAEAAIAGSIAPGEVNAGADPATPVLPGAGAIAGLARRSAASQPSAQNSGAPLTADPAAKTQPPANNTAASGEGESGDAKPKLSTALTVEASGEGERKRGALAKPAELIRTIAGPAGAQTQLKLVRSGDSDVKPLGGIDQTTSIQLRAAPAVTVPPAAQLPQVPVAALAVHIAQQANNGVRRFDIRLDPPELGRVEVRLDVTRDGHVTTHLVVERSETLDLLQRDARALERALQNAGLDTPDGAMKFSLKDQGQGQATPGDGEPSSRGASLDENGTPGERQLDIDNAVSNERRYIATGGLNIRI